MMTRGRRAGSGTAFRSSSRTIHGTLPSPNSRKPSVPLRGVSSVQPKWISGGSPRLGHLDGEGGQRVGEMDAAPGNVDDVFPLLLA